MFMIDCLKKGRRTILSRFVTLFGSLRRELNQQHVQENTPVFMNAGIPRAGIEGIHYIRSSQFLEAYYFQNLII